MALFRRFYWTETTLMVDHHDDEGIVYSSIPVLYGNAATIVGIHAPDELERKIVDLLNEHFHS